LFGLCRSFIFSQRADYLQSKPFIISGRIQKRIPKKSGGLILLFYRDFQVAKKNEKLNYGF
jgi:hypothetical protein